MALEAQSSIFVLMRSLRIDSTIDFIVLAGSSVVMALQTANPSILSFCSSLCVRSSSSNCSNPGAMHSSL